MQLKMARILAAFALLVIVSGEASAQRNAVEAWDPSAREFGRLPVETGLASDAKNSTLEALNKILASAKLSDFDRSIYLSIRAYTPDGVIPDSGSLRSARTPSPSARMKRRTRAPPFSRRSSSRATITSSS